jgi:hypothetical protein
VQWENCVIILRQVKEMMEWRMLWDYKMYNCKNRNKMK